MNGAIIIYKDDSVEIIQSLLDLCDTISEWIDLLVLGDDGTFQESEFSATGKLRQIHWFKGEAISQQWDLAPHAVILAKFIKKQEYQFVISSAGENGNRLSPMLSVKLGGSCLTDLSGLKTESNILYGIKSVYGMNLQARFIIKKRPAILSVLDMRTSKTMSASPPLPIMLHNTSSNASADWFSELESNPADDTCNLKNAANILIAGRGTAGKEGFANITALAELLGAKVGSTRPLVQEAVAPQSNLIGVSGTIVSPKRCLIFGASGAAPFTSGIGQSETIFGVNSDPDAALFSFCDFGVVDDCSSIVESLLRQLRVEIENDGTISRLR